VTSSDATVCVGCLGELDYPANRDDLVRAAGLGGATADALGSLGQLAERNYTGKRDVLVALTRLAA